MTSTTHIRSTLTTKPNGTSLKAERAKPNCWIKQPLCFFTLLFRSIQITMTPNSLWPLLEQVTEVDFLLRYKYRTIILGNNQWKHRRFNLQVWQLLIYDWMYPFPHSRKWVHTPTLSLSLFVWSMLLYDLFILHRLSLQKKSNSSPGEGSRAQFQSVYCTPNKRLILWYAVHKL